MNETCQPCSSLVFSSNRPGPPWKEGPPPTPLANAERWLGRQWYKKFSTSVNARVCQTGHERVLRRQQQLTIPRKREAAVREPRTWAPATPWRARGGRPVHSPPSALPRGVGHRGSRWLAGQKDARRRRSAEKHSRRTRGKLGARRRVGAVKLPNPRGLGARGVIRKAPADSRPPGNPRLHEPGCQPSIPARSRASSHASM